jgi:hypothetical protein
LTKSNPSCVPLRTVYRNSFWTMPKTFAEYTREKKRKQSFPEIRKVLRSYSRRFLSFVTPFAFRSMAALDTAFKKPLSFIVPCRTRKHAAPVAGWLCCPPLGVGVVCIARRASRLRCRELCGPSPALEAHRLTVWTIGGLPAMSCLNYCGSIVCPGVFEKNHRSDRLSA